MDMDGKVRVGISCGDLNGIGMEVILKTFEDPRMLDTCCPIIYASNKAVSFHLKALGIENLPFNGIHDIEKADPRKLNVLNVWKEEVRIELGKSTPVAGKHAFLSLEHAVRDLAANKTDVLVTAPINKHNIQSKDFQFPGHTEYLAHYANEATPVMLLVYENIRVGTVTGHIPLKDVAAALTIDKIVNKLTVLHKSLQQDFLVNRPKIAVLGLNPHAGDNGLLGTEEQTVIAPAIRQAADQGIMAFGPFPADGFFGSDALGKYDAVLAMYHDQGLAPFKTIAFKDGVNYTAGLPIVRTSPDHGTAYAIAGSGQASPDSFRSAVLLACDIFGRRKQHHEMTAAPLKAQALPREK